MPVAIKIEYDDREVVEVLNRLFHAGQNLTPAMREIASALDDAAAEAFDSKRAPSGEPWADLSEHTKRRRSEDLDAEILDVINRHFEDALRRP